MVAGALMKIMWLKKFTVKTGRLKSTYVLLRENRKRKDTSKIQKTELDFDNKDPDSAEDSGK